VRYAPVDWRPDRVRIRDLALTLPGSTAYGSCLRLYPTTNLYLRDLFTEGGAAGIGMPYGHTNSYPIRLDGLVSQFNRFAAVWADKTILRGGGWSLSYSGRNAIRVREADFIAADVFYAASQGGPLETIKDVFRFDDCNVVRLAGFSPNFEGSAPQRSYYRCTPAYLQSTRVDFTYCLAEKSDGPFGLAVAVLLDEPVAKGGQIGRVNLVSSPVSYQGPTLRKTYGWE
jgi:hypothetical protein